MNTRKLLDTFNGWREQRRQLVLATVFETSGSTYSKAGAQMLIDDEGNFQGMLSGGCLEGDLAERAAAVLASGIPQTVTFDLGSNDDGLWGLGVGCDGVMRVFLQSSGATSDYQPFASFARIYTGNVPGAVATVISSDHADVSPGATLALQEGELKSRALPEEFKVRLQIPLAAALEKRTTSMCREQWHGKNVDVLLACVFPPPHVLVLGAGLDAQPMVRMINELGWRATVQDHRLSYIQNGDFRGADQICNLPAREVATALDLAAFDAAIVMSHHLVTDRTYLEILAGTGIPYIGLLGPAGRRERLLRELGGKRDPLQGRLHGPAGLDIGGRGPAAIAVSIVAEMHRKLMLRGDD